MKAYAGTPTRPLAIVIVTQPPERTVHHTESQTAAAKNVELRRRVAAYVALKAGFQPDATQATQPRSLRII